MPRKRSILDRIERATALAECASKSMHDYNMAAISDPEQQRYLKRFRERMALVKQAQVERLTRWLKAAFDKARNMTLDELTAKPGKLKIVAFDVEAA